MTPEEVEESLEAVASALITASEAAEVTPILKAELLDALDELMDLRDWIQGRAPEERDDARLLP